MADDLQRAYQRAVESVGPEEWNRIPLQQQTAAIYKAMREWDAERAAPSPVETPLLAGTDHLAQQME